ncbi:MAG TPA: CDP-alcohol phosphatidyltransferase family protein, partial [Microlunatus sp.]
MRTERNSTVPGDLLALAVLLALLLLPDRLTPSDLGSFAAIPVELVLGGVLLLVLPDRARQPVAAALGVALGALTVLKIVDVGFYGALARPFDLVLDWTLLPGVWELLHTSLGSSTATLIVAGAGLLVLAILTGATWASLRLARLLHTRSAAAVPVLVALGACWLGCATAGVRAVPPYPVASASSTAKIVGEVGAVREGLVDQDRFAAELARDRFRDVPADRLLTGLRGKQVLVIFVESYGRVALTDPDIAPTVTALLDDGTRRLGSAGWQSRSGYLTSPTAGGGSWLAHATLLSGLWIDSQQRYRNLVASDRLTLTRAFGGAGWRTIGVMPGNTSAWPDGDVYCYDEIRDSRSLGYAGPAYGWARVPDQYTLAEAGRLMTEGTDPRPTMAVVPLVSSHAP